MSTNNVSPVTLVLAELVTLCQQAKLDHINGLASIYQITNYLLNQRNDWSILLGGQEPFIKPDIAELLPSCTN